MELPPQDGGTSCDVVVLAEDTQVKTTCPCPVVIELSSSSGGDLPEGCHVWRRVAVLRPVQHGLPHGPGKQVWQDWLTLHTLPGKQVWQDWLTLHTLPDIQRY